MAVAVGASVAAVIIIILTLICLCMWSRRWKRDQQKAEIIRNFPPHTLAAYGGGTLPLAPHPSIGGGSFLPAYVDGSNFNKAAIIASQAAAIQRAASIAGSRSGSIIGPGLVNTSTGPYNSSMSSQPPLPQPPSSTLEAERMRWSASQGARGPGFSDNMMKQNVYAKPDGNTMRNGSYVLRFLDNRKTDPRGTQSSSTMKNGVFTNPQTKSNFSKRNKNNRDYPQNHPGEEYPLSIRSKTREISREHSKRKSSIAYLNKQNLSKRQDRRALKYDESRPQNNLINLQRSPSKRQVSDMVSGSSSDINPRRLTPSSGETFIDSNSEDGEEEYRVAHEDIRRSRSFHQNAPKNNSSNWQKQERRIDRSNSRYNPKLNEKEQSRRRRVEKDLIDQNFGHVNGAYYGDEHDNNFM